MGVISFVCGLKGKVGDLLHYRYKLQNDNIEQLERRNKQLDEDNARLQEQVSDLEVRNAGLELCMAKLTQQVSRINKSSASSDLSTVAVAVLDFYRQLDKTILPRGLIISGLKQKSFGRIQVESAIGELTTAKMLSPPVERGRGQPTKHSLLQEGKKYIVDNM